MTKRNVVGITKMRIITCNKCRISMREDNFSLSKLKQNSHFSTCKQCIQNYNRKHYEENKDKKSKKGKEWYLKNKGKVLDYLKNYRKMNPSTKSIKLTPEERQLREIIREKDYRYNNSDRINARNMKYHCEKLNRTPKWLSKDQLEEINKYYKLAKEMELLDNIKREVDHIIPLRGDTVSGLHVPWNLQILTLSENRSKKNYLIL